MANLAAARGRQSLLPSIVSRLSTISTATADSDKIYPASSAPSLLSPCAAKSRLLREHNPDKALSIISSIPNPSSSPASSRYAVELAVRRLTTARRFADIETLLESRKSDPAVSRESFVSTIILAYGFARMLDRAISTFEEVPRLCSSPHTAVSFNAVLTAAVRAKKHRKVHNLFTELSEKHSISPDTLSYGILIKSLCLSGNVSKASEIFKTMEEKGFKASNFIYTSLLDLFYKKGDPEKAEELWNEMAEKGCKPDLASYNVKIMHQASHGSPEEVLESISKLETAGLKPDTITWNYLMTCYSLHERYDDMNVVYKGLKRKGCHSNAATFKIMLNSLCKKGDYDAAIDVFKDSVKRSRIPDFQTLRHFVELLVTNSRVEDAKMVIAAVKETFPDNLLGNWKMAEKELGLNADDGKSSSEVEAAES